MFNRFGWRMLLLMAAQTWLGLSRLQGGMLERQLQIIPGDQCLVLHWPASDRQQTALYRSPSANGPWTLLQAKPLSKTAWADLDVTNGAPYFYQTRSFPEGGLLLSASATPQPFASDEAFLDFPQRCGFLYFWFEANPRNGLIRDRSRTNSFCSIAANGFGMSAMIIAVERGWLDRKEAAGRALAMTRTFRDGKQGPESSGVIGYRGWFYHFLDMETWNRFRQVELSSIDTALLLAGFLHAKTFFNQQNAVESEIRANVEAIYNRIDWHWMLNGGETLSMGWHPEHGFIERRWTGYNEGMILYILGLGAERKPLPPSSWKAWTADYNWASHYGFDYLEFAPLFGHQYSHCWIDFRGVTDEFLRGKGIDYFENSRRATLAQRRYAIANPKRFDGYSAYCWGLTACDGPGFEQFQGYSARGAPPAENDDGTIAPTAAGGSIPFAPEICIPTLRNFYAKYRKELWTAYGFRDAFNLTADWRDPETLGIDQGPIVLMIENYRTGSVWKKFMQTPEARRGLDRAGFRKIE
jgi:hypothetical protein